jgi:hypothetical protein
MSPRTRYWIIHWVRVVLWPLPVMTMKRVAASIAKVPELLGKK